MLCYVQYRNVNTKLIKDRKFFHGITITTMVAFDWGHGVTHSQYFVVIIIMKLEGKKSLEPENLFVLSNISCLLLLLVLVVCVNCTPLYVCYDPQNCFCQ